MDFREVYIYIMEYLRFWGCLAITSLAAAAVLSVCPVSGEGEIYRDVLRLRVVAASDSEADQADKLAVRDAVLDLMEEAVGNCSGRAEAEEAAASMMGEIAEAASDCLRERGTETEVRVSLGWERSPRRDYGSEILPAGRYRPLKVTIGSGEGHNWWCVLFPGICMRAASGEESIPVGLTPEEYRIITKSSGGRVRVKFWILEKLEGLAEEFGRGNAEK